MAIRAFASRKGQESVVAVGVDDIAEVYEEAGAILWVDLSEQTATAEELLTDVFGLHPLNVEDVFHVSQPKLERHPDYLYLIAHAVHAERKTPANLSTAELDIIVGPTWIVTHHDGSSRAITEVQRIVEDDVELLRRGSLFIAHAILDRVIDEYLPLMERFDDQIDRLEVDIFRNPRPALVEEIFDLKHALQRVLRLGYHQREFLRELASGDVDRVPSDALPFFRDVSDHFIRVMDLAESYRQLMDTALNGYLSFQSHRLNEIMRVLTVLSTIILPLTLIVGYFGMNFDFPEYKWPSPYNAIFVWSLLLAVGGGFFAWLKSRKWL
jgi:magnesium transporter